MKPNPKLSALEALAQRILDKMPKGGKGGTEAQINLHSHTARLADAAKALSALHSVRNPTETEGAHIKRVATAAQKMAKEVEAARERVQKTAHDGLSLLQARIAAKTNLKPDAYAAEVRAVFRTLPHTEQVKLLSELIDQARGPEFAAIVKAPRTITGLQEDMRAKFESAYISRHAAEELLDEAAIKEAAEAASVAVETAGLFAAEYNDPAKLAEISKAEAAAAAAAKAFDSTVNP